MEHPTGTHRRCKMTSTDNIPSLDVEMFRPPVNRAMRVLDRSFFHKKIPLVVAAVSDPKHIGKCRTDLTKDVLRLDRMQAIKRIHDDQGQERKALMLRPEVKQDGRTLHMIYVHCVTLLMLC